MFAPETKSNVNESIFDSLGTDLPDVDDLSLLEDIESGGPEKQLRDDLWRTLTVNNPQDKAKRASQLDFDDLQQQWQDYLKDMPLFEEKFSKNAEMHRLIFLQALVDMVRYHNDGRRPISKENVSLMKIDKESVMDNDRMTVLLDYVKFRDQGNHIVTINMSKLIFDANLGLKKYQGDMLAFQSSINSIPSKLPNESVGVTKESLSTSPKTEILVQSQAKEPQIDYTLKVAADGKISAEEEKNTDRLDPSPIVDSPQQEEKEKKDNAIDRERIQWQSFFYDYRYEDMGEFPKGQKKNGIGKDPESNRAGVWKNDQLILGKIDHSNGLVTIGFYDKKGLLASGSITDVGFDSKKNTSCAINIWWKESDKNTFRATTFPGKNIGSYYRETENNFIFDKKELTVMGVVEKRDIPISLWKKDKLGSYTFESGDLTEEAKKETAETIVKIQDLFIKAIPIVDFH